MNKTSARTVVQKRLTRWKFIEYSADASRPVAQDVGLLQSTEEIEYTKKR